MTERKRETASESFRRIELNIEQLINLIEQGVNRKAAKMAQNPKNGCLTGDLGYIQEQLANAAAFLMETTPENLLAAITEVQAEARGE